MTYETSQQAARYFSCGKRADPLKVPLKVERVATVRAPVELIENRSDQAYSSLVVQTSAAFLPTAERGSPQRVTNSRAVTGFQPSALVG
jgi:hypothetical protein